MGIGEKPVSLLPPLVIFIFKCIAKKTTGQWKCMHVAANQRVKDVCFGDNLLNHGRY